MTVFLPWRSEFGVMILRVVRMIHAHQDPDKIVCTKPGLESLFPSAQSFVYDWLDVADIHKNCRLGKSRGHRRYMGTYQEELSRRYPTAEFVTPISRDPNPPSWNFRPTPKVARGLNADIVIGPRKRDYATHRNYSHWQFIIDSFRDRGLTVAAIGARHTSETNLVGLTHRSWDHDVLDAGIELLQKCRLAVMTESGGAHLAVLCGAPLKVIYVDSKRRKTEKCPHCVFEMKRLAVTHCEPVFNGWSEPSNVVRDAVSFLGGTRKPE